MAKGRGKGGILLGCVVCIAKLFGGLVAFIALIGLGLSIWMLLDLLLTNDELVSLATMALKDDTLRSAYYIFIASVILAQMLGGVSGMSKKKKDDDEDDGPSCASIFGVLFSLALIAGHVSSGVMAVVYRNDRVPNLDSGMKSLLYNDTYMNTTGSEAAPEYTKLGQYYNFLQTKFECCGVSLNNGEDYVDAKFETRYGIKFPYSCCKLRSRKDTDWRNVTRDDVDDWGKCESGDRNHLYQYACHRTMREFLLVKADFLVGYNFTLVILCAASFCISLVVLFCSCCCG